MSISFFNATLAAMGLTTELNTIAVAKYINPADPSQNVLETSHYFTEVPESGDIRIHYHSLNGQKYQYRKEGNKWPSDYVRIRKKEPFLHKETGEVVKYITPTGAGLNPFFYSTIITAYQAKTPIPVLVITEGEKKAVAGCLAGLPTVGIPSIHGFYSGEQKGKLHDDILDLMLVCKVEKIIFLTDADTLVIKYEKDKDLAKRQTSFYSAVKYFRESLQFVLDDRTCTLNVYFAHIKDKYKEEGKGLDDLLLKYADMHTDVLADLYKLQFATKYFHCSIITDGKVNKVHAYFGLTDEITFYNTYKEYIGAKEFLFRGRRYEWDGEQVQYVRHEDTDKYLRVGADWMKIIKVPNKYGEQSEKLIPYKISEISRDYKKYPDFVENIPRYDSFCNQPNWMEEYKRIINNNYNLCDPIMHTPKEGEFPHTLALLKHLFQGNADIENNIIGDQYTVALDWLTLIFQRPTQMLPVPILVSKENKTGKSTFLKWLQAIYGNNMAILGNDQFKMKFNAHYITKFIIAIDEGFLDVDKKAEKERLKQLATADMAFLENKGMNIVEFPYYGKLVICSNDADSVMRLEDEETRWFVVKVPQLSDDAEDPDMEEKLKAEIPAFLHYLRHRPVHHPKTSRLWFKTEWFITEQFRVIVENTKTMLEKELIEFIKELFFSYRILDMRLPLEWIATKLNNTLKYRVNKTDIKKLLNEKRKMVAQNQVAQIPVGLKTNMAGDEEVDYLRTQTMGRPYLFLIDEWLTEEEIGQVKKIEPHKAEPLPF